MPVIHRMTPFWKCALCGAERLARDLEKRPRECNSCHSADWFTGNGTGKRVKAKRVRVIGRRPLVVQESGAVVLRIIKTVEADLAVRKPVPESA